MNEKLDIIHQDLLELRKDVKGFANIAIENKKDISWLKGCLKTSITFVLTILSGIILYWFKAK